MTEYFIPFKTDVYVPSIGLNEEGEQEVNYTWCDKDGFNEAVLKGYMSSP